MTARLHVLLGEGGVGKTTLAAGSALALAREGGNVALLSVDPARRLQSALGLALGELEARVTVAGPGALHAALLLPEATLRRWATEGLPDEAARAHLLGNRFFRVLADRLAATTDVIAAVRIAEWLENDPSLTDLVVDTAPGRSGIEFFQRPDALVALLQGRLVGWLRRIGARGHAPAGEQPPGFALRVLRGLSRIGGVEVLLELAQLVAAVEQPFHRVLSRLERAQSWLHEPTTSLLLVTAVREDSIATARVLRDALLGARLRPAAVVVNRVLPQTLPSELDALDAASLGPEAAAISAYARAFVGIQTRVVHEALSLAPAVVALPGLPGLDSERRLEMLASLGHGLLEGLRSQSVRARAEVAPGPTNERD